MNKLIYILPGDPAPLARGKIGGRYAHRHIYDPQANIKLVTGITIREQHGNRPAYEGALELFITFYFPIPAKHIKKISPGTPHKTIPDNSNCLKFLEDVCQSIGMFKNDCQIAHLDAWKRYGSEPRTEFYFVEIDKEVANGKKD